MTDDDVLVRVQKAFASVFGRSVEFSPTLDRGREPRWTSLKHIELMVALEGEFSVRFDGADATDMTNIPVLIERIKQRLP